jgi:hypothetical protein
MKFTIYLLLGLALCAGATNLRAADASPASPGTEAPTDLVETEERFRWWNKARVITNGQWTMLTQKVDRSKTNVDTLKAEVAAMKTKEAKKERKAAFTFCKMAKLLGNQGIYKRRIFRKNFPGCL